jgi:hypothetical protein
MEAMNDDKFSNNQPQTITETWKEYALQHQLIIFLILITTDSGLISWLLLLHNIRQTTQQNLQAPWSPPIIISIIIALLQKRVILCYQFPILNNAE